MTYALLLALVWMAAEAEPAVRDVEFFAACDGSVQRYVTILPAGFSDDRPHDVLIALHGHGSDRWQFVRDPRDECRATRDVARERGMICVSPDYRAPTSWMGPRAEADLVQVIGDLRRQHRVGNVFICGGSMGGTGCLTFAALHPDLISGVASMNGTANLLEYENFQDAIRGSFGGSKAEVPSEYRNRSAEYWPERLVMPVGMTVGGQDKLVPPDSVRRLASVLAKMGRPVLIVDRPEGGHETSYADARKILEHAIDGASRPPPADEGAYVLVKPERTMEQVEKAYAEMPPVRYAPPPDRWDDLPRTAAILGRGEGELRVVMLGDSIVNDTSRSLWDGLLARRFPGCSIVKTTCVRGSTGCWWYKEPGRVRRYVLDHRPDLLIIGGISQREDIDSIRDVVRQVREGSPCDVLLMTGAFGATDPRDDKAWRFEIDPQGQDCRARLRRLAAEVKAGFLDMHAHWGKYVREAGKELDWWKRDPVHANERGEQILGRILLEHLSPSVADGDPRGRESIRACEACPASLAPSLPLEDRRAICRLDGPRPPLVLPAQVRWISKGWNGENAQMPYLAYLPEKDRLLLLVNCLQPMRAAIIESDDHGKSWKERRWLSASGVAGPAMGALGLTYLGKGKLVAFPEDLKTLWRSSDSGATWTVEEQGKAGELYTWDPLLVLRDPGGRAERLVEACWRPTGVPWGSAEAPYSQAFLRSSADEGRAWTEAVRVPQWLGVNEVSIAVAANGDWIAACRTDYPKRFAHLKLDHYGGLAVSISRDRGQTWSDPTSIYEWGRHHPGTVVTPEGEIIMTYGVRLGYPDAASGLPRFGIEAVTSGDHGRTWDLDHRYVLAAWTGNIPSTKPEAWFSSVQSTSTVRLPDGTLLTAFGTGVRNPENAASCKMDVMLLEWRLR
jgi:acetyl esterase/lipase